MPSSLRPVAALLAFATAACGHVAPGRFVDGRVPPSDVGPEPEPDPVAAAPAAEAGASEAPAVPAPPPAPRSLDDLLELALAQDPEARAAWHDARAAAAAAGSRRASWYPQLAAAGDVSRSGGDAGARTSAGVSASLSWLLFDLARGASIEQADQQLLAARLGRRAAVLDLVLQVQETYYQYLGARALVSALESALKQADTSLAAAEDRRRAGVATIADVLQARTAQSQARLRLQEAEGQALALRGALATLAGLPPTAALEVGELPAEVAREAAELEIGRLLDEAAARNPDLARARALAAAADANARAVARSGFPTLGFDGGASRSWPIRPDGDAFTNWSFGITLRFPVFEGFGRVYDTIAARESAAATSARADATRQQVMLDVWTSHQALRTAGRRLESARDLLEAATLSAEVAAARYKEGVGSILDLLTAQSALDDARAEDVRARADWLVAFARLARTTGRLDPHLASSSGEAR